MNEAAQRIAIAEACGLFKRPKGYVVEYRRWEPQCDGVFERVRNPDGSVGPTYRENLPNYPHDLNAMHEAEKTITHKAELRDVFSVHLQKIIEEKCAGEYGGDSIEGQFWCIHATAAQRAEAFLRTIGKWKEDAK